MEVFITFLIGYVLGFLVHKLIANKATIGFLRVDTSDPEDGPYLFLELHKGMEDVISREYVTLKVKREDLIPRK